MEKKFKVNFILKGIAVFAFVAFCLLAILAGVTLPFVSNASTTDSAVASAEIAFATASSTTAIDYDSFTIPFSQCNTTDTYYGFYITQGFYNFVKNTNFDNPILAGQLTVSGNNSLVFGCNAIYNDDDTVKYNRFTLVSDPEVFEIVISTVPYVVTPPSVIFNNGFTFSVIFPNLPVGFSDNLKVFTSLPYEEKETIIYKTNIGFQSRFGFVGTMPSSNLYLNLQEKPILPDSVRRVTAENTDNLINGWIHGDWEYYLPLTYAYDGFGNSVDGGFTGWHLTNIMVNGVHSSSYNVWFEVLNEKVFNIGTGTIVNGNLNIEISENNNYLVESNFTNSDNLLVFSQLNNSFKYYLQPNISQNDVYKFFALIDYRNYKPADNDFYVAGYNSASSGYYDTGYKKGYAVGNTDGYNNGFSAGDAKGYQRGLNDANNYTFLSLFGAIFDAPIQALFGGTQRLPAGTKITDSSGKTITLTSDTVVNRGGMLNFELMGVNLSGFVLALFSLSIIIVVIKFALAKK